MQLNKNKLLIPYIFFICKNYFKLVWKLSETEWNNITWFWFVHLVNYYLRDCYLRWSTDAIKFLIKKKFEFAVKSIWNQIFFILILSYFKFYKISVITENLKITDFYLNNIKIKYLNVGKVCIKSKYTNN